MLAGGIPVCWIVIGRSMLHPIIGLVELTRDADTQTVIRNQVSRSDLQKPMTEDRFKKAPFARMIMEDLPEYVADLTNPATAAEYEVFERLAAPGGTGYAAFG